jgi:hypothetical protein
MAAAAAARRNWRLVVGIKGNETYSRDIRTLFQHNRNGDSRKHAENPIEFQQQQAGYGIPAFDQKLKVTCRSMRRFAEEFEKPPPWSWFGMSKNREPKMPLGLAKFTLLKMLRTLVPNVRL